MSDEALGVSGEGGVQDTRTLELNAFSVAEVDGGRGVESDACMTVVVVVPAEEAPTEGAAVFQSSRIGPGTLAVSLPRPPGRE